MQARIKDKELGVPNKIRFSLVLYAEPRETFMNALEVRRRNYGKERSPLEMIPLKII